MERAPDCSGISLAIKMYPPDNCRSMLHERQLIDYSVLACMEDFRPLINHGSWHLKIDTAETAVDIFYLKCTIIGEKQEKKSCVLHCL